MQGWLQMVKYIFAQLLIFKNREDAICDIGEEILPLEVCRREASPICSQCSNEKCRRCVYENILTTGDICTPSANYCKVEGGEVK